MKWRQEIKLIGFWEWCWWVFVVRRSEFHKSFNLRVIEIIEGRIDFRQELHRISALRAKAHRIDMLLND